MISFKSFLFESASTPEAPKKLLHLEHPEDEHINGVEYTEKTPKGTIFKKDYNTGYENTKKTLVGVHNLLRGRAAPGISISGKYDGSPSVVFGIHPETQRFFIASKSAFNKNPKLNFTDADIEKNHGHAPGLVAKLKAGLRHLPKVTPNQGVYQGDMMYNRDEGDVTSSGGSYHFRPNTITYSTKQNDPEGQKVKKAKLGIVVHTTYHGDTFDNLSAELNADTSQFRQHPDVHLISPHYDHRQAHYTPMAQRQFEEHMAKADAAHKAANGYPHHEGHEEHLKTYINRTVREETTPNTAGYHDFRQEKFNAEMDEKKTDKGKQKVAERMNQTLQHIDQNKKGFDATFAVHRHLQAAKNALVETLNSSPQTFHHSIGGKGTSPEGYVFSNKNKGEEQNIKGVLRHEFSVANFAKPR